ncbi:hypothetical protein [Saccharospirillum salsuginis]|uniref:Uncharacterized protein n=1 Tax=Saccharospirillum salsuginis TaxID=418750 RepID=A0A918N7G2_9GAMM|nr:hypothetical protein [Saccharospirillum salsuginis]GGX43914.1 hypothetical protein GCM10007392_08340 [Saccharospirillum salsuginis]
MPVIIPILAVLLLVLVVVLKVTSANPTTLSDEQAAKYSKWIRILVPLVLIGAAIRYFMGG